MTGKAENWLIKHQNHHSMATELLTLLAAVAGGLITLVGKWFTAKFSSTTDNTMNLRDSMLKRITQLEKGHKESQKRHDQLEQMIQVWTLRYWALYRWMIRFCVRNGVDIMPPTFHEMEDDEIRDTVAEMYRESNPNDET